MIRHDMQQSSPDWWLARRGVPTASQFYRIMTPVGKKLAAGSTTYAHELIAAVASKGVPLGIENYSNPAIEHGVETEAEARDFYAAFKTDEPVTQVGFCTTDDGRFGGSPDSLIGKPGVLEIKCPQITTHVAWLDEGIIPVKHMAQVHGHLLVTGREYCDFMSYCPGLPELLIRAEPDDYTKRLGEVLEEFWELFTKIKAKPCFAQLFETSN